MNTPAHIAASLIVWRNEPGWRGAAAVAFGAILPDLPMFGFYIFQKLIGSGEGLIWSTLYFETHWQLFFDVFNSIPIAVLACLIGVYLRQPIVVLVAASSMVHMLCDLPVHHDDAHRHFWPLSWKFESPISYWDPRHHGLAFAFFELLFAIVASGYVAIRGRHKPMRFLGRINLGLYLFGIVIAAVMWVKLASRS